MPYVKKLVVHGFKSFAKKTEFPFTPGINVILGPNGSGKSNVTDALCFVLGRLSVKSMRAAKTSNLIFLGTKAAAPAKEASVELIFDNSDNGFIFDSKEISIKRIVRKNGQSLYKINNQTKTRQEVLALLAQAGIDPNGFNIVLQGEIQNFARMQPDGRREVVEEVAGISIYESRKEKSIKELAKTEDKLKEVSSILRERTSYLNNLEKEREAALKHKKLEKEVRVLKKSIFYSELEVKKQNKKKIDSEIEIKNKEIGKIKKVILDLKLEIEGYENKIQEINSTISKQTGFEQEKLNSQIADLRAELAAMSVKKENFERKLKDNANQKQDLRKSITENEISAKSLRKESPTIEKIKKELEEKTKQLESLEKVRRKYYMDKNELRNLNERITEKRNALNNQKNELNFLVKQINSLSLELFDKKTTREKVQDLKNLIIRKNESLKNLSEEEKKLEKIIYTNESKIEENKKIVGKIEKLDVCPLCKSKVTPEHISGINSEIEPKILQLEKEIEDSDKKISEIYNKKDLLKREVQELNSEIQKRQSDILKLHSINDKESQIKNLNVSTAKVEEELKELIGKHRVLEKSFDENSNVDEKYENLQIEVQDISLRNKENITSEISLKEREIERAKITIRKISREEEEIGQDLVGLSKNLVKKESELEKLKRIEQDLAKKSQVEIKKRDEFQVKIRQVENKLSQNQNESSNIDRKINDLKIEIARISAEIENLETEILEFPDEEITKGKKEVLIERLRRTEDTLSRIGSVNMRSLEVYDEVREEYDSIKEKVETIEKEKEGVMKIIHEIDVKKKKVFLKTLEELNNIFTRNFAKISTKGEVFLELQNRKDPFSAGVDIVVKTGHGKYFDVKSLSGGEQTMVALSLIFAIQELKPYCFYILDEIDAALDKRNSSRLAGLLRKYMEKGQYIIITHNDEVITNATNLFGVSMHEGISKVISLKNK